MTPKSRLTLAIAGLVIFTGLAITLLMTGQPAEAVGPLILVIALGIQQLLQALDNPNRIQGMDKGGHPISPTVQRLPVEPTGQSNQPADPDVGESEDGGGGLAA